MSAAFPRGRLWSRVLRRAVRARTLGALQPIETERVKLVDGALPFSIHVALSLIQKSRAGGDGCEAGTNPFLPYDPDLFVCRVSGTHLCLLNKFPVVDHHLLIVTRQFEPQENILSFTDFQAARACLSELDGLVFFNSGPLAGASQPHRHLQFVPFPIGGTGDPFPFEPVLRAGLQRSVSELPALPFRHAAALLPVSESACIDEQADRTQAVYGLLLDAVGLVPIATDSPLSSSEPYNLLMTRDWLMVVPRTAEGVDGISINGLAFVGSMFVKNRQELRAVIEFGPSRILMRVCGPVG